MKKQVKKKKWMVGCWCDIQNILQYGRWQQGKLKQKVDGQMERGIVNKKSEELMGGWNRGEGAGWVWGAWMMCGQMGRCLEVWMEVG